MKNLIKTMPIAATVALLVAGAFLFAGCEKEKKTEENKKISTTEISLSMDCIYDRLECEKLVEINSQGEFDNLFSGCNGLGTDIDFQKQTLFLIYGISMQCVLGKDIIFEKIENNYQLTLKIHQGDCHSVEKWNAFFVTEKINSNVSYSINLVQ